MSKRRHDKSHSCKCSRDGCHCDQHGAGCQCGHEHRCAQHREEEGGTGMGFAVGVAIGAAAVTLLAPDQGKKTRDRAKQKLDELTGGKTPEELLDAVKEVVSGVVGDIRTATDRGKKEAKRHRQKVLESSRRQPRKR